MRIIISILLLVALTILNYMFGNAISIFLSVTFFASVLYFIRFISFENKITLQVKNNSEGKDQKSVLKKASEISKKQRALSAFFLLTVVFISSIICLKITTAPNDKQAYFFNNNHHALAHKQTFFKGVFEQRLMEDQYSNDDSNHVERYISWESNAGKLSLKSKDFLHPIFLKQGEQSILLNKIFSQPIKNSFSITHPQAEITVTMNKEDGFWRSITGKSPRILYSIDVKYSPKFFNPDNVNSEWVSDSYSFYGPYLMKGMNIYNLLFDKNYIEQPSSESVLVLQEILHSISSSYLIAQHVDGNDSYYFFPDEDFFLNNLKLKIDGQSIEPIQSHQIALNSGDEMYIGFNNERELLQIVALDTTINSKSFSAALIYDHPPYYWLNVPESSNYWNSKMSYFMTNDFNQMIDYPKDELFFFNNYNLQSKEKFSGVFQFMIDNTQVPLLHQLKDINNNASSGLFLSGSSGNITYGFELRDFSDNGFSFPRMLIYSGFIYVLFLAFLLLFPGKNLGRIEGVIFVVIYALFLLRMIMYWRLATFPPVENISKHELENTLLNFDFNLGFKWPVPLTLVWLTLFVIVLAVLRTYKERIKSILFKNFDQLQINKRWNSHKSFAFIMFCLLIVYFFNDKILGIEPLTRVLAIIAPITLYILYSIKSNDDFVLNQKWARKEDATWIREIKAYFYYLVQNPAFIPSMLTLIYLGITDRGFAVLFFLFLLLKTILLNFLKKSYNSSTTSFGKMLVKPHNYWIYGIIALIVYMVILSVKSLFYHALQQYIWVVGGMIFIGVLFIYLFFKENKKLLKGALIVLGGYIVLMSIPFTRNGIDSFVVDQIKHVQYRMSIIYQPISELLLENEYSSFNSRKIIETAENQWFINSYISKEYNPDETLNLRSYNKVGVDYNTQTRDVVLARFVISEMGDFTMYSILLLMVLPLILYLIGFQFHDKSGSQHRIEKHTYVGIVPLILFFTICLFVWLTSTNRFVFFGQDFPFLSLTSKTSMVLPLILFGIVLLSTPKVYIAEKVSLNKAFFKYILFVGMIAFFALVTVQPNTLNTQNFSVIVHQTQDRVDNNLNNYLAQIQDSLASVQKDYTYVQLIQALKDDPSFQDFFNDSITDPYTSSIMKRLLDNPHTAFEVNSPVYMQYDGYRYFALYNQNFYLELPSVDNKTIWRGNVVEDIGHAQQAILQYGEERQQVQLPYFKNDVTNNIHLAIIPHQWLANNSQHLAIVEVVKDSKSSNTTLSTYRDINKSFEQRSSSFAGTLFANEHMSVKNGNGTFNVSLSNAAPQFAVNKWINGQYRILYPSRPKSLWLYSFAQGMKTIKSDALAYHEDVGITLDFELNKKIEKLIHQSLNGQKKNKKFKFTVMSADGDGAIRLIQDFVSNRKSIDANDQYALYRLRQKQFFFSNIKNERDQWGEANLLNMQLGPGSSIKPLSAAIVASQVNAGWEHLILDAPMQSEYNYYAGFKLIKPWKNDDHYIAPIDMKTYIEASSNFYQSVILFLGSYPKEAFIQQNKASIANVLSKNPGNDSSYPSFNFLGQKYFFSNYNRGNNSWPASNVNDDKKTYFGNENSLLANGFEVNGNLMTKDKNKTNNVYGALGRVNIIDTNEYQILKEKGNAYFLWSMPEENSFFQSLRAPNEIHQNVNIGLKTATLGGYPYQLSSFKMLEMYASLFTQNRNFRLQLKRNINQPKEPWHIDNTWNRAQFNTFLSQNIFAGMNRVIFGGSGTLKRMQHLKSQHPQYYFYAKTGTINEQGSGELSSRRLIIAISDKDLQSEVNLGQGKVYLVYFTVDRNKDFDWTLVNNIMTEILSSASLKLYFNS